MDGTGFMHFSILLTAICLNVDAYSTDLHLYQVKHNFQVVSISVDTLKEVPCLSMLEGISICLESSDCKVINHFEIDRRCQLVTNLLASAVVEAVASASILCECFSLQFKITVIYFNVWLCFLFK